MLTIGVAVEVPEPYGSLLRRHRAAFGDVLAETVPTHVTLLPPTSVPDHDIDDVAAVLDDIAGRHAPFSMRLRGTGTFRPISPVVFVAVSEGISQTEMLAASVRSALLRGELQFPYHPHVTVAHHIDDAGLDRAFAELADFECTFAVDSFALYLHDEGAGWSPTKVFDLREPGPQGQDDPRG